MTWTLVLTLFFSNQQPKKVTIPNWSSERHCYIAGGFLREEHEKDESVSWSTISCDLEGNS